MKTVLKLSARRILLFWVMAFAVTLNAFATPLGGECLEEDGRLCCVAAEFLCPSLDTDSHTTPWATGDTLLTATPDDCGEGHCYWLSQDNAPHLATVFAVSAHQELVAVLPPAVLPHTAVLGTASSAYRANAPPGRRSVKHSYRAPRAPPSCT